MARCGVVLAAGRGTRLAPFSDHRPKASFPVGSQSLLDRAVSTLEPFVDDVAVNASEHRDWFEAEIGGRARIFDEPSEPLGTAGALINMAEWIDGRDVVVLNVDSVFFGEVGRLLGAPMSAPTTLVTVLDTTRPDFDPCWRFSGLSLMTAASVAELAPDVEDLYHDLWKHQLPRGDLVLTPHQGLTVDCGTPMALLAANLIESGGETVVEAGATVDGSAEACVILSGGHVATGEVVRHAVIDERHRVEAGPMPPRTPHHP